MMHSTEGPSTAAAEPPPPQPPAPQSHHTCHPLIADGLTNFIARVEESVAELLSGGPVTGTEACDGQSDVSTPHQQRRGRVPHSSTSPHTQPPHGSHPGSSCGEEALAGGGHHLRQCCSTPHLDVSAMNSGNSKPSPRPMSFGCQEDDVEQLSSLTLDGTGLFHNRRTMMEAVGSASASCEDVCLSGLLQATISPRCSDNGISASLEVVRGGGATAAQTFSSVAASPTKSAPPHQGMHTPKKPSSSSHHCRGGSGALPPPTPLGLAQAQAALQLDARPPQLRGSAKHASGLPQGGSCFHDDDDLETAIAPCTPPGSPPSSSCRDEAVGAALTSFALEQQQHQRNASNDENSALTPAGPPSPRHHLSGGGAFTGRQHHRQHQHQLQLQQQQPQSTTSSSTATMPPFFLASPTYVSHNTASDFHQHQQQQRRMTTLTNEIERLASGIQQIQRHLQQFKGLVAIVGSTTTASSAQQHHHHSLLMRFGDGGSRCNTVGTQTDPPTKVDDMTTNAGNRATTAAALLTTQQVNNHSNVNVADPPPTPRDVRILLEPPPSPPLWFLHESPSEDDPSDTIADAARHLQQLMLSGQQHDNPSDAKHSHQHQPPTADGTIANESRTDTPAADCASLSHPASHALAGNSLRTMDSSASLLALPHSMRMTTTVERTVDEFTGIKSLNQYVLMGVIGQGSCGKVKLAFSLDRNVSVAIKIARRGTASARQEASGGGHRVDPLSIQPVVERSSAVGTLSPGMSPVPFLARSVPVVDQKETALRREIAIMKKLRHKNIVALYEVIDDPAAAKLYLVMQYVDRGCVSTVRGDGTCGRLPLGEVLSLARQVAAGLGYLHQHGVVHRDIKPENILASSEGRYYLSDFGVSDLEDVSMLSSEHLSAFAGVLSKRVGTRQFMAPEQFAMSPLVRSLASRSASITPAIDVWALGVTLLALALGRLPSFASELMVLDNCREDCMRHVEEDLNIALEVLVGDVDASSSEGCRLLHEHCAGRLVVLIRRMLRWDAIDRCRIGSVRVEAKQLQRELKNGTRGNARTDDQFPLPHEGELNTLEAVAVSPDELDSALSCLRAPSAVVNSDGGRRWHQNNESISPPMQSSLSGAYSTTSSFPLLSSQQQKQFHGTLYDVPTSAGRQHVGESLATYVSTTSGGSETGSTSPLLRVGDPQPSSSGRRFVLQPAVVDASVARHHTQEEAYEQRNVNVRCSFPEHRGPMAPDDKAEDVCNERPWQLHDTTF